MFHGLDFVIEDFQGAACDLVGIIAEQSLHTSEYH